MSQSNIFLNRTVVVFETPNNQETNYKGPSTESNGVVLEHEETGRTHLYQCLEADSTA